MEDLNENAFRGKLRILHKLGFLRKSKGRIVHPKYKMGSDAHRRHMSKIAKLPRKVHEYLEQKNLSELADEIVGDSAVSEMAKDAKVSRLISNYGFQKLVKKMYRLYRDKKSAQADMVEFADAIAKAMGFGNARNISDIQQAMDLLWDRFHMTKAPVEESDDEALATKLCEMVNSEETTVEEVRSLLSENGISFEDDNELLDFVEYVIEASRDDDSDSDDDADDNDSKDDSGSDDDSSSDDDDSDSDDESDNDEDSEEEEEAEEKIHPGIHKEVKDKLKDKEESVARHTAIGAASGAIIGAYSADDPKKRVGKAIKGAALGAGVGGVMGVQQSEVNRLRRHKKEAGEEIYAQQKKIDSLRRELANRPSKGS